MVTDGSERRYANTACPYCGVTPDPVPKAKSRCRACGESIYVRSGPDGLTYLLQEADLPVLDAAWVEVDDAKAADRVRELNAQAARDHAESLADYRELGATRVQLIGADDACPACVRSRTAYPLDAAPPLPIPGCSSEICRCDYIPLSG